MASVAKIRQSGIIAVLGLAACAIEPPRLVVGDPPTVRLGQIIELTTTPEPPVALAAFVDPSGDAQVLIVEADAKSFIHLQVTPDGEVRRQRVDLAELVTSPGEFQTAIDTQGRLHVLAKGAYWHSNDLAWVPSGDTPWAMAGIEARPLALAVPADGLTWLFAVDGKVVDAPGRWDWFGFGGPGAAIVFPWHVSSSKMVVAPDRVGARRYWRLVDPEDGLDVREAITSVDAKGRLHVAYTVSRRGILSSGLPRYLLMMPDESVSPAALPTERAALHGEQIPVLDLTPDWMRGAAMAADASGDMVMFVTPSGLGVFRRGTRWRLPERLGVARLDAPSLAAAGSYAFHLISDDVGGTAYRLYSQAQWSAPLSLDEALPREPRAWAARTALGARAGVAFAVWSTASGVVGRWIDARATLANVPAVVPEDDRLADLSDFAAGRATLVEPGLVSGFSEAAVAGVHTMLARRLHDDAQWEALATLILNDRYGDNVRWYFLGRAAEGLGWCDAAQRYYATAEAFSAHVLTRCLGRACGGVVVPEALAERRSALDAARRGGGCKVEGELGH
jgi:hypothetical protein